MNNPSSSAANLATKWRSAAEAWPEVRDELRASRAEFIRARSRVQAAGEALDDFLLEYLQEGPELTGNTRKGLPTKGRPKPPTAPSTTAERTYARRTVMPIDSKVMKIRALTQ